MESRQQQPATVSRAFDVCGDESQTCAFQDWRLAEIAQAIASELPTESVAESPLVAALASSLAARFAQKQITPSPARSLPRPGDGLDRRRLARVLEYVDANLEGNLSIDRLASIACLSRHHFARAFKQAVGQSPHRYVAGKRLEHAKALLKQGDRSLVEIALALRFSDQACFTRAFRQATSQTPGQYRQGSGSRQPEPSLADVWRDLPILA